MGGCSQVERHAAGLQRHEEHLAATSEMSRSSWRHEMHHRTSCWQSSHHLGGTLESRPTGSSQADMTTISAVKQLMHVERYVLQWR